MKTPGKPGAAPASAAPAAPAPVEIVKNDTQPVLDDEATQSFTSTYEPPHRKILCNPAAGDVYRRERGSPWRVDVDEKLRLANLKAQDEQQEKRRWGLAKQIQDGLVHTFGMSYGVAELSTLLKTGISLKAAQQQDVGSKIELASHEVAYVQLLAAAEKYDLKQVVLLLDKFPKGRNASSNNAKRK